MIPSYLKIEGLYSYQGVQEINFDQLTQAHIFGIFGATGSGKSSILEAITFALYGQSSRLNQQDKRGYNMMNLKSNRLYIEFDFKHGESKYKFCVEGKRNSKRFEQVGTIERKVYVYEGEQLVPSKLTTAEAITGLSYENFSRTIIIPQGKFQEFLQLTETERTRMLKEIFKLEKFELYPKTISLERKNKEQITRQETLFLQLAHITEETLRDMQTQTKELEAQLETEKKNQEILRKELTKLEEIQALGEELSKQKEIVSNLVAQKSLFTEKEHKVRNYESCLVDFKPLLDKRQEDSLSFDKNKQSLSLKQKDRTENIEELEKAEKAFQQIKSNYEQREQFLKRAEEFQSVISLKESEQNIVKLEERIHNGTTLTDKKKRDIEQMKLELSRKSAEARTLREEKPDMDLIMKLQDWFNQRELKEKDHSLHKQRIEAIRSEELLLQEEKTQLLKTMPLHVSQYQLTSEKLIQLSQKRLEEQQSNHTEQEDLYEKALAQSHLHSYAAKLDEGDPCPLCGAVHHPNPIEKDTDRNKISEIKDYLAEIKATVQREEKALVQLQLLAEKEALLTEKREQEDSALRLASQEKDKHEALFVWKEFDKNKPEQTQEVLKAFSNADIRINLLNQEWEALEKTVEKEEQTREKYLVELEKIKKLREREKISFESQIAKLGSIDYEKLKHEDNQSLEQLALLEKEQYKGIEDMYQSSEQRILKLRSRVDMLKGEIAELEKQETNLAKKMAESNLQLEDRLLKSTFSNLEQIESLLDENINIDVEKQAIHQFKQDLLAAETNLENISVRIKGKEVNIEYYNEIVDKSEISKRKIEDTSLEIGGQRKEVIRVEAELKRKKEIQTALQKLELRAEDIRTLKQLFARSGFVNYVSSIFLKNLCLAANHRFTKLSRGSLSLEPTEGNSFEVRDMLNNGQTRSVKTLSGGQTFQAALSLAIALADQVQQQAEAPQNFFFLDEGFGSQDQKSLQVIFQTLKSLRKENRIVGVISHVEELHQEIDSFLFVENDPEKGSQISTSWE